jgi:RNA polymerase sigma factor (sigma-70 family)
MRRMTASTNSVNRRGSQPTPANQPDTLADGVAEAALRHLAGDQQAMADLVRLVMPWLFRLCRGYRLSAHTAEDVVQCTLLALIKQVQTLRDPRCTLGWLTVVARREALRAIRSEQRVEPVGDQETFESVTADGDPERMFEATVSRAVLVRNLAKLPDRSRELLRLMFLVGAKDYASLATLMDMPIGSIGPTRQRGLARMRELLRVDVDWYQWEAS